MSAERPYQARPEDVIEFDSTHSPETPIEQTPSISTAEARARQETNDEQDRTQLRASLAERIEKVKALEAAEEAQKAQEASRAEAAEQVRNQKLAALDSQVQDPRKWMKQNPDLEARVLTKLQQEPEWNREKRSKVSWATFTAGGASTIGGALVGPAFLSAPVSWPFILGGVAVIGGGQLVRGGMKLLHSRKEKKHQKEYAEATGRKYRVGIGFS